VSRRPRRQKRLEDGAVTGYFYVFVLSEDKRRKEAPESADADDDAAPGPGLHAVGVVSLQWNLRSNSDPDATTHHRTAVSQAGPSSGRIGFLQYCTSAVFPFDTPVPLDPRSDGRPLSIVALRNLLFSDGHPETDSARERLGAASVAGWVVFPSHRVQDVMSPGAVARSIALCRRSRPHKATILGGPNVQHLQTWANRRHMEDGRGREDRRSARNDPLTKVPSSRRGRGERKPLSSTAVPSRLKNRFSPDVLLAAIYHSEHLRDQDMFLDTLQRGEDYMTCVTGAPPPVGSRVVDFTHPSTTTNQRSLLKLDAVACLVERRTVHEWIDHDRLRSCHIYADGSPVASSEIQAMIIDFALFDGTIVRSTLPAVILGYCLTASIDKVLALLWALWLVVGPDAKYLQAVVDKVISFTTDLGVEHYMVHTPDIVPAFMRWIHGEPLAGLGRYVNYGTPLFKRAFVVPGWGHLCASVMKYVCKFSLAFPKYLTHMRALCALMHINTWREYLAMRFKDKPFAPYLNRPFTANIVKWRYATLHDVADQLLHLRSFFENDFTEELWNNPQEPELIKNCLAAKQDKSFWRWLSATFRFLLSHVEHLRRWGLTCDECSDLKKSGRPRQTCFRCGRRLQHAGDVVLSVMDCFLEDAKRIRAHMVEDDSELRNDVAHRLRAGAAMLRAKFEYMFVVPCLLAVSDRQAGAKDCLEQMQDEALQDKHEAATLWWKENMMDELQNVANGGEPSERHKQQLAILWDTSLNESISETYHRGTTVEKQRAPATTRERLICEQRRVQHFATVRQYIATTGEAGKRAFHYEWYNYKRLLQTGSSQRSFNRRRKMKDAAFHRRMYIREDLSQLEWKHIVQKEKQTSNSLPPKESVRVEYLQQVLVPSETYGYQRRGPVDGDGLNGPQWTFFQVLDMRTGHNKPMVVSTASSSTDPTCTHRLASLFRNMNHWNSKRRRASMY
jgi:hypothetical protein